jgi:hypothetical protein
LIEVSRSTNNQAWIPSKDPEITESILARIPECLRKILQASVEKYKRRRKGILISSNSLANRFILERWGIRPSQRRRYRNLFATIRRQCRTVFQHYLARKRIEWINESEQYLFGIYKFDEIRGNLILGFVAKTLETEWTLPHR